MPPRWVPWTTTVLALAGLAVSAYLTLDHYDARAVPLACSDTGVVNCVKVTTSPQSMLFGVMPVAVLGLAFFVAMVVIESPPAWRSPLRALHWFRLASVVIGVGFVCYLVYTELFTLDAICLWCTAVHALTFVIFALTLIGAALASPTGSAE